jgi:diamine N-acetyltransferase
MRCIALVFRLAVKNDLSQIKTMYKNIIIHLHNNNIPIWNDIYPCDFFWNDIDNNNLYILTKNDDIIAAVVLNELNDGEAHVKWENIETNVLYIERLGVNINYLRQGLGGLMLENVRVLAKQLGVIYLRLFVRDINKPAINFYIKNGFNRVEGIYKLKIGDQILREYGFEIKL